MERNKKKQIARQGINKSQISFYFLKKKVNFDDSKTVKCIIKTNLLKFKINFH